MMQYCYLQASRPRVFCRGRFGAETGRRPRSVHNQLVPVAAATTRSVIGAHAPRRVWARAGHRSLVRLPSKLSPRSESVKTANSGRAPCRKQHCYDEHQTGRKRPSCRCGASKSRSLVSRGISSESDWIPSFGFFCRLKVLLNDFPSARRQAHDRINPNPCWACSIDLHGVILDI